MDYRFSFTGCAMIRRALTIVVSLSALAGLILAAGAAPKEEKKRPKRELNNLSLEVAALQVIWQLDFTPGQLKELGAIAKDTVPQNARRRKASKASTGYYGTVHDLRDALLKADDEKIMLLTEKLDKLNDTESPELDD